MVPDQYSLLVYDDVSVTDLALLSGASQWFLRTSRDRKKRPSWRLLRLRPSGITLASYTGAACHSTQPAKLFQWRQSDEVATVIHGQR
jgi:hypothetical protein